MTLISKFIKKIIFVLGLGGGIKKNQKRNNNSSINKENIIKEIKENSKINKIVSYIIVLKQKILSNQSSINHIPSHSYLHIFNDFILNIDNTLLSYGNIEKKGGGKEEILGSIAIIGTSIACIILFPCIACVLIYCIVLFLVVISYFSLYKLCDLIQYFIKDKKNNNKYCNFIRSYYDDFLFHTSTIQKGGNNFHLIIKDKEKLKNIYEHIKITKNINDITDSDAEKYYNFKKEYGEKDEYISEFYEFIVDLLNNKLNKDGIRSIKVLNRLQLILNIYYNEEITEESTKIALIEIENIRNKKEENKTEIEKSLIIELNKFGNETIIQNELKKNYILYLEDIDKNIFKLKILNSYKKNIVDYEVNKYTFNQFRNEISKKIQKNIPQNITTIKQIVNQKLISNNNQIVKNITTKKKSIKEQINILKNKDINKDLYKEIHELYKEIDEESKIKEVPIKTIKQISFTNNNYTRYKKINEYQITCRESNTGITKKICEIKELIKKYVNNVIGLETNEEKKKELIKIMQFILKIKKVEKNINNQAALKNRFTSNIEKKGFVNNLMIVNNK